MSTQPNNRSFATYVNGTLKGAGQVMFQGKCPDRPATIIGIFAGCYLEAPYGEHMPVVAWGALAGLIVSTATGYIFESKTDGDQGLWGFNGILVGCAVFTFLDNTVWSWIAMIIGSAPYRSSPSRAQQCLRSVQDHILHIPLYPHIVAYTPVGARYGPTLHRQASP